MSQQGDAPAARTVGLEERVLSFVGHLAISWILGFASMFAAAIYGIEGPGELLFAVLPALVIGFVFGRHAGRTRVERAGRIVQGSSRAQWVWVAGLVGFAVLWSASGFADGFYNEFIGSYCGDFRCLPGWFVTAPAVAMTAYSAGAFLGQRSSRTGATQLEGTGR